MSPARRQWLAVAGLAGVILAVFLALVVPRSPHAQQPHLRVRGDTLQYVAMISGEEAQAPFRYRLVVPALARVVPLPPLEALRLITLASLWAGLGLLLHALRTVGFGWRSSLGALLCLSASPAQLELLHNPFLTDAAGWLVLCGVVWAVVQARFALFAAVVLVGVLVREATLFVAPAWLALEPRRVRAWLIPLGAAAVWWGVQGWLGAPPERKFEPRPLLRVIGDAAVLWHVFWVLGAVGLWNLRPPYRERLGGLALLLLGGAGLSSAFATDTGRMFAILGPALTFGIAWCLQRLPRLGWVLVGVTAACSVIWVPMVFDTALRMSPAWRPWRAAALCALAAVGLACLWALWRGAQAGRLTPERRTRPVF